MDNRNLFGLSVERTMYRQGVLYLCAIILIGVHSFPLDEDVCENNNYFGNLQAYNSDELELLEDACPVPRGFNRREIPARFRKPIGEYEDDPGMNDKHLGVYQQDMYLDKTQREDESNENTNPMVPMNSVSQYSPDSYQPESKYCPRPKSHQFNSFHQKSKSKYPKYESDCMKYVGGKSYRVPPFETFYKSYSQYGGMKELNTENVDELVEAIKKPQSMELDIKEELIDKPTDVEEVNVERVVQETNDKSNDHSADKNEEKLKQDDEDNRETSENDEADQDETEEDHENANNEKIMLKKQQINEDVSTTENIQDQTTINM